MATKIKHRIFGSPIILSILMYLLTLSYFIFTRQTGSANNQILGVDKIILGQTLGLLIWGLGIFIDRRSRALNGGKILFKFQKVIFPVGTLIIFTLIFKLIFKL